MEKVQELQKEILILRKKNETYFSELEQMKEEYQYLLE